MPGPSTAIVKVTVLKNLFTTKQKKQQKVQKKAIKK